MTNIFEWQDPEILQNGREKPRSNYSVYSTEEEAMTGRRGLSPYFKLLNGNWNYLYFNRFIDVPEDISQPASYDYDWQEMPVPSMLRGDTADFSDSPDFVSHDNPTAVYSRAFYLPESWENKSVYISFEGIGSAFYLSVNGIDAGYSEGDSYFAEFDITSCLNEGENFITVKVMEFSVPKKEKSKGWGIFSDVYLLARDKKHIKDFNVTTEDEVLTVRAEGADSFALRLMSPFGEVVAEGKAKSGEVSVSVGNAEKWTAESPFLYKLLIFCGNEVIAQDMGFVKYEATDGMLRVNGVAVNIRCAPCDSLLTADDFAALKRQGINTLITTGLSCDFLRFCNKYGFYVKSGCTLKSVYNNPCVIPCGGEISYSPTFKAPLYAKLVSPSTIKVFNGFDFTTAEGFDILWKITLDDKTVESGSISLPSIRPHGSRSFNLKTPLPDSCFFGCSLDVSFREKAEAGYEIGFCQFELPAEKRSLPSLPVKTLLTAEEDKEYLVIYGDDFTYAFNKLYGRFDSIVKDGVEFISENSSEIRRQYVCSMEYLMCEGEGISFKISVYRPTDNGSAVSCNAIYTVLPCGEIEISAEADFPAEYCLAESMSDIKCYGKDTAARLGLHRGEGSYSDMRFAALSDSFARGLMFFGDKDLTVTCKPSKILIGSENKEYSYKLLPTTSINEIFE